MKTRMHIAILVAIIVGGSSAALAGQPKEPTDGAEQALSMFSHCLQYAGNSAALRGWAADQHLQETPEGVAAKFLMKDHPGKVFGGATSLGKVAIVSQDDGGCSVFTDQADSASLFLHFEEWLHETKFTYSKSTMQQSSDKLQMKSISYEISGLGRTWSVTISAAPPGKSQIQAIMTAYGTRATASDVKSQ